MRILDNRNNPDTVNFTEKIWDRLLLVERARHGEKERYAVASLKGGVRSLVATTSAITAIGEYSCYLPKASQDLQGIDLFVIRKNHQVQDGVVAVQIGSSQNTEFHLEPIYVKDIVDERVYLDDQNHKNRQKQNELREASERHSQEWRFGVNSVYIDLQGAGPRNIIVNPQTGLPRDPESLSEYISESQLPKVLQQAFADMDKGGSR